VPYKTKFLYQDKIDDLLYLRRLIDTAYDMKKDLIKNKALRNCRYVYTSRYEKELNSIASYIFKYNDDEHKPIRDYAINELEKMLLRYSSNSLITTETYVDYLKVLLEYRSFEDLKVPKLCIEENVRKALVLKLIEYKRQTRKDRSIKLSDFLKLARINEIDIKGKYLYCIDFVAVVHYVNDSVEFIILDNSQIWK